MSRRINLLTRMKFVVPIVVSILSCIGAAAAQSAHKTTPGDSPGGVPQATFFVHRLGTDHAEGITTLDMNGDGRPDILSGAYWYENPGPAGGDRNDDQYRKDVLLNEFVSDYDVCT